MFLKRFIISLMVVVFFSFNLFAQNIEDDLPTQQGPRKKLTIIVFAGLTGAILGLSTLSFYGRPQDKLANIAIGFALGVISGAIYTTYKTATEPYGIVENNYQDQMYNQQHFETYFADSKPTLYPVSLNYRF